MATTQRHLKVGVRLRVINVRRWMPECKVEISILAALLLAGSLLATGAAVASEDVLPTQVERDIQPGEPTQETSALRRALALSSGKEAMRRLSGGASEKNDEKNSLHSIIPGMECSIDGIAAYASCYSALIDTQEAAENFFTRLISELQAVLPSDRWRGMKKEPGIASSRSYTYADQRSNAHIDIDMVAQHRLERPNSYIVSTFWWPR